MNPSHDLSNAIDMLDRTRFPVDEWKLTEAWYSSTDLGVTETVFAVGNGYLGMRGNVEEGRESHAHGTFINGFHETWQIRHAEEAFGFARIGQTIVNVPDAKTIKLYVDDEPLLLSVADLESYGRTLDFADGVLRRELIWRTPSGKKVRVVSTRMVSFTQRHLAIMTFEVTMLSGDAPVAISSQVLNRQDGKDEYHVRAAAMGEGVDPRKASEFRERVLNPQTHSAEGGRITLGYRTAGSGMTLAVGVDHTIETENPYEEIDRAEEDLAKKIYRVDARQGVPILVTKVVAYHSSRGVPVRELVDRCDRTLARVRDQGVAHCLAEQRAWLDRFWADADVEVGGHPAIQQAVRWNLFQLAQAAARVEQGGVPAKGVSGSGYEGHFFWDTEIYVMPFLTYTSPGIARGLMRFRYQMLPMARRRARDLAQRGALYPWRTISGEEASAYYAAGTAQYHIDADIAYALVKYVRAAGDEQFMIAEGIDVLVETARMWADLGFWLRGSGPDAAEQFHIHGVTGPDEYTTVVNNNLFTNVMAKANLREAAFWTRHIAEESPQSYERLVHRLDLDADEVDEWARIAEGIHIPYDARLKVHPQDQHFLEREVWDLDAMPAEKRPLLLHYHPLVIYRFQVLKQADVVAALFLQNEEFTPEQKLADFEYYDPITTGDSSLSAVVQSIIASEVGYLDLALRYFLGGLFVDLADLHRNASDGVHVASAGGVWDALVYGFGGMRDSNGVISFDPRLPASWPSLTWRLRLRGTRVQVTLTKDEITFEITDGGAASLDLVVRGETVTVTRDRPTTVGLKHQGIPVNRTLGRLPLVSHADQHEMLYTAGVPDPDRRRR